MVLSWRTLAVALLLSLAVVLTPSLWWVWAVVLVSLVVVDILLAASPRAVRVSRIPPRSVRLGQSTVVRTRLQNTGRRRLVGLLREGWQPSAVDVDPQRQVVLEAGGQLEVQTELTPRRRGELSSPHVTVRSMGPLGLAGRQRTHRVPHRLPVMPAFASRKHLPSKKQRLRELDGAAAVRTRGGGTEFDSLRDYVHGDDVRSIDWRGTARRQHLVVRTWRPERDRRVILCLDTSRTSAARIGDEPRVETGMEAALLLGALASSAGDRTDFMAFDRQMTARASSQDSGEFTHRMAVQMIGVQPVLVEADFSQLPVQIEAMTTQRSLVVLFTSLESASVQEGLLPVLPVLCAKHTVLIASVQDPELRATAGQRSTVSEAYAAAAAERTLLETAAVRAELTSMGARVVEAGPHQLPPVLADAYIRLKAEGRL